MSPCTGVNLEEEEEEEHMWPSLILPLNDSVDDVSTFDFHKH